VTEYNLDDFEPGPVYSHPTHTVAEEEALDFAHRYDPQDHHLDPVAARDSVFGALVLGGFQTASFSSARMLRTGMFDRCAMAGIGLDDVRWHRPVRPGQLSARRVHADRCAALGVAPAGRHRALSLRDEEPAQ
jgi:acyl dehydratase